VWIPTAWQNISPEDTVKGFKKCCITNAMDGTDDDMLWNGSKENEDIKRKCEGDVGTACEGEDSDTDW
jgi:hypothetical protein